MRARRWLSGGERDAHLGNTLIALDRRVVAGERRAAGRRGGGGGRRRRAHIPRRERAHRQGPRGGRPHRGRDRRQRPRRADRDGLELRRAQAAPPALSRGARLGAAPARPRDRSARARRGLPGRRRRLPQLRRAVRRHAGDRHRVPVDRAALQPRHEPRGPPDLGAEDLRQRRHRRGRARGPLHPQPARPRAPHRRDGALPAQRADEQVRHRLADHQRRQHARDLDRPEREPRRVGVRRRHRQLPVVAQEPPAQRGLVGGRHRPQPQLGLAVGLLRRLQRHVLLGDLPRPVAVLGARDPARARLRHLARHRRRAADQDRDRLPHLLRARPVALRLHDRQHGGGAGRRRRGHVPHAGHQHGQHERLHARAGQRPVHRRRHDRRLAVGPAQDLRLHVRAVPEDAPAPASIRPTSRSVRRRRATARRSCDCWRSPTARSGRSARRRSTAASRARRCSPTTSRPTRAGRRRATRPRSGASSVAIRRRRAPAAPSNSARPRAASTTSSPAGWPAPRPAPTTWTAASRRCCHLRSR